MIQRIQSIWLFLAAVVIFGLFLFPYLQFTDLNGLGNALKVTGEYHAEGTVAVQTSPFILQTIAAVMLGLLPLYTIFQFKNRKKQGNLIYLNILLVLLYGGWLYYVAHTTLTAVNQSLSAANIGIGFFLLPIYIILLIMALGGIRNDEKLIRSANRLR